MKWPGSARSPPCQSLPHQPKTARIAFVFRAWRSEGLCDGHRDTWILRAGPPGGPPGPRRLSTPVGLAFTTGPPPVLAVPGARGRVQGRSCCAGAAGDGPAHEGWEALDVPAPGQDARS